MEERMSAVEGKLESMGLKLEHMERSMQAETAAIRKELQKLMRMTGGHLDGNSNRSQGSVNEKDGGPNGSGLTDSNARGLPEPNGSRLLDPNESEWAKPKERGLTEPNGKGLLESIGSGLTDSNLRGLLEPNGRKLSEPNGLLLEGRMKVLEGRADGRINALERTMNSVKRWPRGEQREVLKDIEGHFFKAYNSGKVVTRMLNEEWKTFEEVLPLPKPPYLNWRATAIEYPSYDNTMLKRSQEMKFHSSNLEDKVVLQRGVMLRCKESLSEATVIRFVESNTRKGLLESNGKGLTVPNVKGQPEPNVRELPESNGLVLEGRMKALEGRADGRINSMKRTMDSVRRWVCKQEMGLAIFDTLAEGRERHEALKDIENRYLRAYDYGKEMTRMLEANRIREEWKSWEEKLPPPKPPNLTWRVVARGFPSCDNTMMKRSQEIKFQISNLEDKVVL
ncbi:hypothetical protein V8G54_004274 [Vigna mungo]|uniref:Uncharacterized protein n=1 Tax=Vigna mungo TaxID=3915 RepID=A0AAQ3PGE0_VIGMU